MQLFVFVKCTVQPSLELVFLKSTLSWSFKKVPKLVKHFDFEVSSIETLFEFFWVLTKDFGCICAIFSNIINFSTSSLSESPGSLERGDFFGVGEDLSSIYIITTCKVECLVIPRLAMQALERHRKFAVTGLMLDCYETVLLIS